MEKYLALLDPKSCLNKAKPDEPIFILRANDPIAAQTIRLWAVMAKDAHDPEKIEKALKVAEMMQQWKTIQTQPKEAPKE